MAKENFNTEKLKAKIAESRVSSENANSYTKAGAKLKKSIESGKDEKFAKALKNLKEKPKMYVNKGPGAGRVRWDAEKGDGVDVVNVGAMLGFGKDAA